MKTSVKGSIRRIVGRTLAVGVVSTLLVGTIGCVVHDGYYARPYVRRTYYYGPDGRVYVRETYVEPSTVVVTTPPPAPAPAPVAIAPESPAAAALHPLVAPIALYPDPLLAELLPATTFPQQVQDAGAWLAANPNPTNDMIEAQPWAPSVKAIVHYPTVVTQLTGDMQWTESLGSAYSNQPADVMAAIQQMRAQAIAEGNLVSNSQESVIQDGGVIAIQPANPDLVYVPTYDPVLVYVGYHPLYFGTVGYAVGPWFSYGVDWGGGFLFVGDWHGGYYYRNGGWGRDYAFRADRFQRWDRPARFGPPPHVEHYAMARGVAGREAEIHRTMTQHAAERRAVQVRSTGAQRPGQAGHPEARTSTPARNNFNGTGGDRNGLREGGLEHGNQEHGAAKPEERGK